jgi:hypothetical protein
MDQAGANAARCSVERAASPNDTVEFMTVYARGRRLCLGKQKAAMTDGASPLDGKSSTALTLEECELELEKLKQQMERLKRNDKAVDVKEADSYVAIAVDTVFDGIWNGVVNRHFVVTATVGNLADGTMHTKASKLTLHLGSEKTACCDLLAWMDQLGQVILVCNADGNDASLYDLDHLCYRTTGRFLARHDAKGATRPRIYPDEQIKSLSADIQKRIRMKANASHPQETTKNRLMQCFMAHYVQEIQGMDSADGSARLETLLAVDWSRVPKRFGKPTTTMAGETLFDRYFGRNYTAEADLFDHRKWTDNKPKGDDKTACVHTSVSLVPSHGSPWEEMAIMKQSFHQEAIAPCMGVASSTAP